MTKKILCLCPTYDRPQRIVEHAIANFRWQHARDDCYLYIHDDSGLAPNIMGDRWCITSSEIREPSLPAKYDSMVERAESLFPEWDAIAVWDDDDLYLPWHLATAQTLLESHDWVHPSYVWSDHDGVANVESAAGRFHGSLVVRRDLYNSVGGWLGAQIAGEAQRADFDQRMLSSCETHSETGRGDPAKSRLSYCFRWGSTRTGHAQGLMRSPSDSSWYTDRPITQTVWSDRPRAKFDVGAMDIARRIMVTPVDVAARRVV